MPATLYIVATPIGNMADITFRAVEILKKVDYIAAEDTRHSAYLLQHYSITAPMLAYHDHSGEGQTDKVLALLLEGKDVALISDAGTPLISDPGYRLVKKAQEMNLTVVPVPGASALIAALSVSGLPTDRFTFYGFLPAKTKARRDMLEGLKSTTETMIFYEAPHRILEVIEDMEVIFGGGRLVTLARELTKSFETIKQKKLGEMRLWMQADTNQQRGEIVIVLEGMLMDEGMVDIISEPALALIDLLVDQLPPKSLSRVVAEHYQLPKKLVYDYIIGLKK